MLIFQATGGFPPGKYQLILGVEDRVSKKIAAYRKEIVIPDMTKEELGLSSIILAAYMEPQERASATGRPFHMGRFLLVPQPNSIFYKKDELNIYFQIYEPARDEETGRPRLDVLYTFKRLLADGSPEDMGSYQIQDSGAQVQGYAVPLKAWPEGEYIVTVTVFDRITGKPVSGETTFILRR